MRLTSRNVLREILPPFLLGLAAYTFILLLRSLLQLSEMVIRRGMPLSVVLELLLLTLPQVVVLTIPMAFLFGILIGVGRLSGDSEIIALRACGISRAALYRPVAGLALVLTAVVTVLSVWGYPAANDRLERLENRLFASAALEQVRPRTFSDPRPDWMLFVDRDQAGTTGWRGVFLDDRSDPGKETVILAREGRFRFDGTRLWLELFDATSHSTDARDPAVYRRNQNATQSILLREAPPEESRNVTFEKGLRLQTLPELLRTARQVRGVFAARYRLAWVEIHKKFAIPLACLVFGLVGLPLGVTNRRGGKGSGFAVSIGIILAYYLLLNNGESWAEEGRLSPFLAMWLPNLLLLAVGIVLLLRREEERRSAFSRARDRLRAILPIRRLPAAAPRRVSAGPAFFSGLTRFPAGLDRYVLGPFLLALAAVYASVTILYVVVDYSDHLDDILRRHIPRAVVLSYYRALLLPIFVQILPFCLMIAALIALGSLSRHNEDTAFKACGVPLVRLGAGILFTAFLASGAAYLLGEYSLPEANRRSHELLDRIKGRTAAARPAEEGGLWVLGSGNRIWNFDSYDPGAKRLYRPSVYELDPEFRLLRRISAAVATWDGARWIFETGWSRTFSGAAETSFTPFAREALVREDPPRLFSQERQQPDEMRYRALARYIERLRKTGYPVASLETALAAKPAGALQTFVLAVLALPFAFSIGKRGTLTGIGVGLACGMLFLMLAAFCTKLGEVGSLPPHLAAWSPDLTFLLFAGYRMTRMRT